MTLFFKPNHSVCRYELLAQTGGLQEAANELFRSQRKDKSWTDIKKRSPPLKNVISTSGHTHHLTPVCDS